jgi:predicted metal-binding membrane protein
MTALGRALAALGLIRPARRRGFCPACRLLVAATGQPGAELELAPPALTVLACLVAAALAWALMLGPAGHGAHMAGGSDSLASFATGWLLMMAAMMLPSATPLVFEFARASERRRAWPVATGVLGASYLSIWLGFGVACYLVRSALPAALPEPGVAGGLALVLSGLYGLTPLKRASEARCRELCALHGPLPFSLVRSAAVVGATYGLSCVGCSAALMAAMVVIGMSSLAWVVVLSGVVLVYKLAPAPSRRRDRALSAALAALGVVYAVTT